jgi:PHD/YefM family antitoxin component YafN of YafNO toxin-antitoxin module
MAVYTVAQARTNFNQLIDQAARSCHPIQIIGKKHNAMLISEKRWSAIQETLHLSSMPKLSKSIKNGLKTPLKNCSHKIAW